MKFGHKMLKAGSTLTPTWLRAVIRSRISLKDFDTARCVEANPYRDVLQEDYEESDFRLGIIEEVTQYHKHYIAACREMKISYRVLSILEDDWIERFKASQCDAFLVWPSCMPTSAKEAFDYRLYILENELGGVIFPTWKECWLTEHKPRLRDWLDANGFLHPQTWVFYNREDALKFAESCKIPLVVKSATGGSASGISVVRTRGQLRKAIRLAFGRGLRPRSYDPNDRQWGYVYIQEYFPNVLEWRMVRIADSYFGYRKEPGADGIHSASKAWSWLDPGPELLELTRQVTEKGGFTSMDVDVFIPEDGRLLINECQTMFGCTSPAVQMQVDGKDGRYLYGEGTWRFEEGEFCANHMCNLRIESLLSKLRETKK